MNPRRVHLQKLVYSHNERKKQQKPKRRSRLTRFIISFIQYIFITFVALGAAYSVDVGQWYILAFILYTVFIARDPKLTFGIAVFLTITIPFFTLTDQPAIAQNTTVYVFELLVIGTLQALLDLRSKA
jgi:heme/copper-type cytochrome/quinol oxidase subunit 4